MAKAAAAKAAISIVVREVRGNVDPKTYFKRERKPLPPAALIPPPKNVDPKYLEGPFLPKVANRCRAVAGRVGFQSSTYLPFFSNGYETQVFEPDIVNEVVDLSDNDHVLVNYSADVVRVLNTAPPGGDFPPYAGNGKFVYRFKAFLAVNGPGDKYLLRAQKRKLPEDSVVSEDVVVLVSFSSK